MRVFKNENDARRPPIRIVHVVEATEGGVKTWLEQVVLSLDAKEFEQSCIVSAERDPAFVDTIDRFRAAGKQVWEVSMARAISPLRDARSLLHLAPLLSNGGFDIVHAHSSKAGALVRLVERKRSSTVVYTPHAYAFLAGGWRGRLYWAIERLLAGRAGHIVAVSPSEAEASARLGHPASRITLVPNGVAATAAPATGRNTDQPQCVAAAGRLCGQKDPLTFVRACSLVHERDANVECCWYGGGPLVRDVHNENQRSHAGMVLNTRVRDLTSERTRWSVFALCSRYEGLSFALLEAMAAGVPVVATDVPGNRDIVQHEHNGLLIPAQNPKALADAIARLLGDPAFANELAARARQTVRVDYSREKQLEALAECYRRIAGAAHG